MPDGKQQAFSQAINLWKRILKIKQSLDNPKMFGVERIIVCRFMGGNLPESDLFSQEEILEKLKIRYEELLSQFKHLESILPERQIKSAKEIAVRELHFG